MPELPDVTVYVEALRARLLGARLERARIKSVFLLRSVDPPPSAAEGRRVTAVERVGKRIALAFDNGVHYVFHLMVTGRFRWRDRDAKIPGRVGLAAFDFEPGALLLTEMGRRKRASLHVVRDPAELDPGGLEVLASTRDAFTEVLGRRNHTLKRALTNPRLFSGIGNAYSDEILHRARLSPVRWTSRLMPDEVTRLHRAAIDTLEEWTARLRAQAGDGFPEKVTAFRPEMAVHGRYREPCPDCGDPVQRIVYAENETNYCATCQTGGKLLADRALSQLLKKDWPRTLEEWEDLKRR